MHPMHPRLPPPHPPCTPQHLPIHLPSTPHPRHHPASTPPRTTPTLGTTRRTLRTRYIPAPHLHRMHFSGPDAPAMHRRQGLAMHLPCTYHAPGTRTPSGTPCTPTHPHARATCTSMHVPPLRICRLLPATCPPGTHGTPLHLCALAVTNTLHKAPCNSMHSTFTRTPPRMETRRTSCSP